MNEKKGFYKGKFKLFRDSGICDKISTLNCWAEMAWTTDNSFFLFPKKVKTDFYNFFIKINANFSFKELIFRELNSKLA